MPVIKKHLKVISIAVFVVIITNVNPVHDVVVMLTSGGYFEYSSEKADFTFEEAMGGRDFAMMKRNFKAYKDSTGDSTLYRLFSKNPLFFWRYRDFIYDDRYKLPHKSWSSIVKKRGKSRQTGFQDF